MCRGVAKSNGHRPNKELISPINVEYNKRIEMGWTGQVFVFMLRVTIYFFKTCVYPKGPQDRAWAVLGRSQAA
jgi:hypothetical protein